jgi:hypothetical protein
MKALNRDLGRAVGLLAPLMDQLLSQKAIKRSRSDKRIADMRRAAPWFGSNNVVAVLFTRKMTGPERRRGDLSVQFLVRRKLAESRLRPQDLIPKVVRFESVNREFPTDVLECGTLAVPHAFPVVRPVAPGCSIGHPRSPGGTLGLLVRQNGAPFYLSCSHVLAPGGSIWSSVGDDIEQPADPTPGIPANVIGSLAAFTTLDPSSTTNQTDAAIARCNDVAHDPGVPGVGVPTGILPYAASEFTDHSLVVSRRGVGSAPATGTIDGCGAVKIDYSDIGQVIVNELVVYTAKGDGGDSGAAVFVDGTQTVAGLHVGALPDGRSIFTPIQSVFDSLGVTL